MLGASAELAVDSDARTQVLNKLYHQYLPAAFKATTPESDDRVWSSLGYYLRAPTTSRKHFALSQEESDAVVEAVHSLVERLRKEN